MLQLRKKRAERRLGRVDFCMSSNSPQFPEIPGWHFTLTETSFGVYRADGLHDDGRSVSRAGHDLPALIEDTARDARNLPARRKAK